AALQCGSNALQGTVAGSPATSYAVTVAFYSTYPPSGTALSCPLFAIPKAAQLVSKGSSSPGPIGTVSRTMESEVRLTPAGSGASFLGAIYGNSTLSTSNQVTVGGYQGNDGDIYTNGVWSCSNSGVTVSGRVY